MHIAYIAQFVKMGFFRASSWAHSQGTFRVRALGPKPRFWSTAKELQGTILYQYHGISTTVTVVVPVLSDVIFYASEMCSWLQVLDEVDTRPGSYGDVPFVIELLSELRVQDHLDADGWAQN